MVRYPALPLCIRLTRVALLPLVLAASALPAAADDAPALGAELARTLESWTRERAELADPATGALGPVRVQVELGQLDPRLRLAPCGRVEPYLPTNSRPWGRTRVGLRCADGIARWNVYLPVRVRVMATAPVLREPLPAGAEITDDMLTEAEVDWAEDRQPPLTDPAQMVGRRLARNLPAGEALHANDLQRPVWFNAGEMVKVVAVGPGYEVSAQGQALGRGLDGQTVRVRTGAGRVVTGTAVGEHRVEIPL